MKNSINIWAFAAIIAVVRGQEESKLIYGFVQGDNGGFASSCC